MAKSTVTYVFVGQNATCGTPHPITKRMSTWGSIYKFDNRAEAEEYAEHVDNGNFDQIIEVGGRRKMRQYRLGLSMYQFEQHLDHAEGPGDWQYKF